MITRSHLLKARTNSWRKLVLYDKKRKRTGEKRKTEREREKWKNTTNDIETNEGESEAVKQAVGKKGPADLEQQQELSSSDRSKKKDKKQKKDSGDSNKEESQANLEEQQQSKGSKKDVHVTPTPKED